MDFRELIPLLLLQPVTVVKDISDQSVFTNKVAVFECEIKINYPEITLSWYKGTQKLDTNDKYDISIVGDRHLLKIKRCQASDQGNYRVVCGPHISSAKLTVTGQYFIILFSVSHMKTNIFIPDLREKNPFKLEQQVRKSEKILVPNDAKTSADKSKHW